MVEAPAAPAAAPASAAAKADAAVVASLMVTFRPRSADSAIALLPADEPAAAATKRAAAVTPAATAKRSRLVAPSCARPHARVPLSQHCKLVVRAAAAAIPGSLAYPKAPSPEVRAQIDKAAKIAAARPVDARPPPDSKAAKKRPIPKIRPIMPFGDAALGAAHDGFTGSAGSTADSRMFAIVAVPLRVPRPFRLARHRLPSTIAHGLIAAPPPARPG